jgi:hypothetical protein
LLWSLDEAAADLGATLVSDGGHRIALAGQVWHRPWIQVFAMP